MLKFLTERYKKIFIIIFAAVLLVTVEMPETVSAATTPLEKNGELSIQNGRVVNGNGEPFVIKGVSTHGLSWYPKYVNKNSFKTLRDNYGVNTIRLALYTSEYNGYCTGGSKKDLEKIIDKGVRYAKDLGMYVIIDWHILSDGNPKTYQKQAKAFFEKVSKKYDDYDNVLYEICNEPNGSGGSWKNIKSYAYSIIKTIRKNDDDAIIIVGTPTWSQDIENAMQKPIKGYKNIAYSFHFYAGTHKGNMRLRLKAALKEKVPVIVTEFGVSDASGNGGINTAGGQKWISLLDKYKTGRVCWNLSNKDESSAIIKSSCKKLSGWKRSDLTETGKFLLKSYTGKTDTNVDVSEAQKTSPQKDTSEKATPEKAAQMDNAKDVITVSRVNDWVQDGEYYTQYKVTIKNNGESECKSWRAVVELKEDYRISSCWSAKYNRSQRTTTLTPQTWNKKLSSGQSTEIGFIVRSSKAQAIIKKAVIFK